MSQAMGQAKLPEMAIEFARRSKNSGVPWTEQERRMFLLGLQKLGKGDWRGISRSYVISRTPNQWPVIPKNISSGTAYLTLLQTNKPSTSRSTDKQPIACPSCFG